MNGKQYVDYFLFGILFHGGWMLIEFVVEKLN
jgi:hypothetical protein